MITAALYRKGDRYTGFQATGHSGYAETGSDIVCAGVSALSICCVNSLESLLGVHVSPNMEEETGLLSFVLPPLEEQKEYGAQLLMGSLGQGLSDIQDAYPEYVNFQIKERRN